MLAVLESLVRLAHQLLVGLGWAWALEFFAIVAEGAAKDRVDESNEGKARDGFAAGVLLVLSALSTAFLFVHVVYSSALAYDLMLRLVGFGLVAFVVLFGSLVGYAVGSSGPGANDFARSIKLPMAVLAFGATLYATYPSIFILVAQAMRFLS
jgi:hypothetical protein